MGLLIIINYYVGKISKVKVNENIQSAGLLFQERINSQNQVFKGQLKSLLDHNAQLRTTLGSLIQTEESDLFSDDDEDENSLKEAHQILYSSLVAHPLYKDCDILIVLDPYGNLIFSKESPEIYDQDLSHLPFIEDAIQGITSSGWFKGSNLDRPITGEDKFKDTIIKTVVSPLSLTGTSIEGIILAGFDLQKLDLTNILSITGAEIVFKLDDLVIGKNVFENFKSQPDNFLTSNKPLKDTNNNTQGEFIILKSLEKELAQFRELQSSIIIIGFLALLVGMIHSMITSKEVTKALHKISDAVKKVKDGELELKVDTGTNDEFKELGDAVIDMASSLKNEEAIRNIVSKYFSTSVSENILGNPLEGVSLGGEKKEITIFYSDIASFSTFSESLTPTETVQFLNEYFTLMQKIINDHDGDIDKYIGDAILAYWNKGTLEEQAEKAIKSAIQQRSVLKALRAKWSHNEHLAKFDFRVGIHSGECFIGNIGSENLMSYTVIGDNVNISARLEAVNKLYGTNIIVSNDVQDRTKNKFSFRQLDQVILKGKQEPTKIYEVQVDSSLTDQNTSYEQILEYYYRGNFKTAKEKALRHKEDFPKDKANLVILDRVNLLESSPIDNWKGVFDLN